MNSNGKHLREFDRFRIDLEKKVLWCKNEPVQLPSKAVELLCVLVENRGEIVTKDELLDKVWQNAFVEESVLSQNIHHLRKTFKDLNVIQTIPRRGYRFAGEVREIESDEEVLIEHEIVERSLMAEISEDSLKNLDLQNAPQLPQITGSGRNKLRIVFTSIFIALVFLIGLTLWQFNKTTEKASLKNVNAIAVLPLKSFNPDTESEPLRLRITDALITKLGNLNQITVRPTNSVLQFSDNRQDAVEIGKRLGVDAVLDGRVQEENNRLRVTLQLISVKNGEQLWSEQFDGRTGEILDLQDTIANRLKQKFAFVETENFNRRPTENNEAFEAYLKGRFFWNQRTPDSYFKAIRYFEEAVQLDPNFALAYSGMADSYVLLNRRYVASSEDSLLKAEEAALKALELNENLAEAQTSMGLVRGNYKRDWNESENHFRRAIELNPNYSLAYGWYGILLTGQKRFDEAENLLRKAEQLDPTSRNIAVYIMANYFYKREFDKAIEQSRKALELDPKLLTAYLYLSMSFEQKQMYDKAVEAELERLKIASPESVEPLREAYLVSGIKGFWRKQIEIRREQAVKYSSCGYEIATRYALLDEKNEALKIIEANALTGGTCWNSINIEPAFDSLRNEPRFQEVMRKMNVL